MDELLAITKRNFELKMQELETRQQRFKEKVCFCFFFFSEITHPFPCCLSDELSFSSSCSLLLIIHQFIHPSIHPSFHASINRINRINRIHQQAEMLETIRSCKPLIVETDAKRNKAVQKLAEEKKLVERKVTDCV